VPLSEHERQLLEQIEQALVAEDPKFASSYRMSDLRRHYRRRLLRGGLGLVAGLGLLLAGVVTKLVALGVGGFVVMLLALVYGVSVFERMSGRHEPRNKGVTPPTRPRLTERFEERFRRRFDER